MHSLKIHVSYRNAVAIADSDIIGKRFEEGQRQLDIKESFYKGKEIGKEELIQEMIDQTKEDSTFNIVGKNSVAAAIEAGIISKESVGKVQGVPFALVLL